ncbi:hypothetical protein Tco_0495764 [Tanacetum coccineum]
MRALDINFGSYNVHNILSTLLITDVDSVYNVENWSSFLRRPPRNGVELSQFNAMLQEFKKMSLSDSADSWKWGLTSVGYTVASARQFIDDTSLPARALTLTLCYVLSAIIMLNVLIIFFSLVIWPKRCGVLWVDGVRWCFLSALLFMNGFLGLTLPTCRNAPRLFSKVSLLSCCGLFGTFVTPGSSRIENLKRRIVLDEKDRSSIVLVDFI